MRLLLLTIALALTASHGFNAQEGPREATRRPGAGARLAATQHAPLPRQLSQYWFVPDLSASRTVAGRGTDDRTGATRLARGMTMIAAGNFTAGLPLVNAPELARTPLYNYSRYYTGVALLGLSRLDEAAAAFSDVAARKPEGYLKEATRMKLAEIALARQDAGAAENILESLSKEKLSVPEEVFLRLGFAEEAVGHRDHALDAFRKVYYDFPLSVQASDAQAGIERLQTAAAVPPDLFKRALSRAEQLFAARRWAQARAAFEPLARAAQGDEAELVALRLAECDYYLDRYRATRDALTPYLKDNSREAEARFFHLTAVRAIGDQSSYVTLAREFIADHPGNEWAAEALNNLASHYLIADEDEEADQVFRELLLRFPQHRYAERAAWKAGWYAYRNGKFGEAVEIFETAAIAFPRADNRPAWLYWSGRARDQLGDTAVAADRYRLVIADYENSYYGRLASGILEARREPLVAPSVAAAAAPVFSPPSVPNDTVIRELAAAQMYDDALREIQYAQRVWGDSSQLQATYAWIRHKQGLGLEAMDRFNALRGSITTMRRAYPQFMAAGGEDLPPDVLRIIFPLDYWPLIRKYSDANGLDPYLVAALIAQESTFTADIRSSANAHGLMQVLPSTGRRYARKLGIRPFTAKSLSNPQINVRIGTQIFKDLIDRFGGAHYALASYNAGENRVAAWRSETPGLRQDEFIDNIPFPETQNYVKRILGTAEDYRRLYGSGVLDPNEGLSSPTPAAAPAKKSPTASKSTSKSRRTSRR